MQRIISGSQPILQTTFHDHNNVPTTPSTIFFSVVRADTGAFLVNPTSVVPDQIVEVTLPTAATTLSTADKDPVLMIYNLNVRFPSGNNIQENVRFLVEPQFYV